MTSLKTFKDALDDCKKPLIFFHDDPDGLCSFLLLYRYKKAGMGVVVKSTPKVDSKFLKKVEEYQPDKIFIVDIPIVEQDFLDGVNCPVYWIDHHEPLSRTKVTYYNPRMHSKGNVPASYVCYMIVKKDLWVAMVGIVGDWFLPPLSKEFSEKYPGLLSNDISAPQKALYSAKIGTLVRIFSFLLKGETKQVMTNVKILTRIKTPFEILDQTTPQGKYLHNQFVGINEVYKGLINDAYKQAINDDMLIFSYKEDKMSFTSDLGNELLFRHPEKIILVCRDKSGEMKCSLRSPENIILPPILKKSLEGVEGYGGGHEHACGVCVKSKDFEKFIKNLKKELKKDASTQGI